MRLTTALFIITAAGALFVRLGPSQTPTPGLPRITRAYYREVRDSDAQWVTSGASFLTRLLVVFQTDAPLVAGNAVNVAINGVDPGRIPGCGTTFGSAPVAQNGWYAVDCMSLPRGVNIDSVYLTITSEKVQVPRAPDIPPPAAP